jgi:hypothetical protein
VASEDFAASAPGVVAAVVAAVSGAPAVDGPGGAGEVLARLAAPLAPGGPAAVVAAGEALRGALGGAWAGALAAIPAAAGPLHDRLAWAVAELVRAALAEPVVTDARPAWTLVVEVDDAARLEAAGGAGALADADAAIRAALPAGVRCAGEGPGRWRVTGGGAGAAVSGGGVGGGLDGADPGAGARLAVALTGAVAGVPGPHGIPLRASAGIGAGPDEAEERLLAARAAGVPVVGER